MNTNPDRLGGPIAHILRGGTLIAVAVIAVGYLLGLIADGEGSGATPVFELLRDGGPDGLIGAGLLVLTLLPVAVLAAAATGFARSGERSGVVASLLTLALLIGSLATALLIGTTT
ncbi:MAG: DUF1634 domain-containing protein [Chloroflexi bacterium]|nr:DUF1634 domain-containing protein [Chloroflexota bacterium]